LQRNLVYVAIGVVAASLGMHLLPEAWNASAPLPGLRLAMFAGGFALFFALEYGVFHPKRAPVLRRAGMLILIGDTVHNFIDGILISTAFLVGPEVGMAVSVAVLAHELPQELGDFAVLTAGGMSSRKALMLNVLSGFAAVLGVALTMALGSSVDALTGYLIPLAAGNFMYLLLVSLGPLLFRARSVRQAVLQWLLAALGASIIAAIHGALHLHE
jgi:zinc and cadmium transporter